MSTVPCPYCGRPMLIGDKDLHPTRDHVNPKSKSPRKPFNSLKVCFSCNQEKDDMTLPEYADYLIIRGNELKAELELNERRSTMVGYLVLCGLK